MTVDGTRRRLLFAGGALLTAGCTAPLSDDDEQTRLASIVVENNTDQQQTVQLKLRRPNDSEDRGYEVLYDESITVGAKVLKIVEGDWEVEPSKYTLLYASEDKLNMNSIPADFTHLLDADDCNHVRVEFAEPEGMTVWVDDGQGVEGLPSCE
jgi:hypothetical protein